MNAAKSRRKGASNDFSGVKISKNHKLPIYDAGSDGTPSVPPSLSPDPETSAEPDCQQQPTVETSDATEHISEVTQQNSDPVAETAMQEPQISENPPIKGDETAIRAISISQIEQDPALQSRITIHNKKVVEKYAEALRDGDKFPSVDVFEIDGQYFVVDGSHRLAAARQEGWTEFECLVHQGSMRDAILWASGANAAHGEPRTNEDMNLVVNRLLDDPEWSQWSNGQIAKECHVSATFVRSLRAKRSENPVQACTYVDKHGKKVKMNVGNIGKKSGKAQVPVERLDEPPAAPELHKPATVTGSTEPVGSGLEIGNTNPGPIVVEAAPSQSGKTPRSTEDLRPNQIADKFVDKCLSQPQRDFLQLMIKQREAESFMEAIGVVIDRAREEMEEAS
jgi:hypothetical protein